MIRTAAFRIPGASSAERAETQHAAFSKIRETPHPRGELVEEFVGGVAHAPALATVRPPMVDPQERLAQIIATVEKLSYLADDDTPGVRAGFFETLSGLQSELDVLLANPGELGELGGRARFYRLLLEALATRVRIAMSTRPPSS